MYFKIHNEGWVFVVSSLIITVITFPFFPIIGLILLILSFCIFYFFRDPIRSIPVEDVIVSPADGQIVFLDKSKLPEECGIDGNYLKISIFLDLYNVHVNRLPTSGSIKNIKYIPGKFFRANVDKASKDNERNIILIENIKKEKIVVVQIAGLIARRIVTEVSKEEELDQGTRLGMIRFGSRADLYFENYNPLVKVNQKTIAGETLIAKK